MSYQGVFPDVVKKYTFQSLGTAADGNLSLTPPLGQNFSSIAAGNAALRREIKSFLEPNGLEFLLDAESRDMDIVQRQRDFLLRIPMSLVPDTFQRYIFHLAAILSNQDTAILFEEPETHSYGPYVYELAQHILNDERGNQYFLTTHNPYLLTPLLQESRDIAVFVLWFENYETQIRKLGTDEIADILNHGMDIFMNLNAFVPE